MQIELLSRRRNRAKNSEKLVLYVSIETQGSANFSEISPRVRMRNYDLLAGKSAEWKTFISRESFLARVSHKVVLFISIFVGMITLRCRHNN